jgi:hypothetical protein
MFAVVMVAQLLLQSLSLASKLILSYSFSFLVNFVL